PAHHHAADLPRSRLRSPHPRGTQAPGPRSTGQAHTTPTPLTENPPLTPSAPTRSPRFQSPRDPGQRTGQQQKQRTQQEGRRGPEIGEADAAEHTGDGEADVEVHVPRDTGPAGRADRGEGHHKTR